MLIYFMLRIYSVIMLMLQCYACIQVSVSMHNLYFPFLLLLILDVWYRDFDN